MQDFNQILYRLQLATGAKTAKEMAEKLGVTYATIHNWRKKREVPEKYLAKLPAAINRNWLLTGQGNMLHGNTGSAVAEGSRSAVKLKAHEGFINAITTKRDAIVEIICKELYSQAIDASTAYYEYEGSSEHYLVWPDYNESIEANNQGIYEDEKDLHSIDELFGVSKTMREIIRSLERQKNSETAVARRQEAITKALENIKKVAQQWREKGEIK